MNIVLLLFIETVIFMIALVVTQEYLAGIIERIINKNNHSSINAPLFVAILLWGLFYFVINY